MYADATVADSAAARTNSTIYRAQCFFWHKSATDTATVWTTYADATPASMRMISTISRVSCFFCYQVEWGTL